MEFESYKGRIVVLNKECEVHYHFRKKAFSITQNGLVVAHARNVKLRDVHTKVRESGRLQVIAEQRKNVHAHVIGTLVDIPNEVHTEGMDTLYYNPYKVKHFVDSKGNQVRDADTVIMTGSQGYWK